MEHMTQSRRDKILYEVEGFDAFVRTTMREWNVPGLAIGIVKDDKCIYAQGFGKRNIAQDLDVTARTLFAIASCTKSFTAAALGILVDEKQLDWDTPIKHYLPQFKMYDAFATERITVRDLLTHRSGLPRHELVGYNSSYSRKELVERLQYLEPNKDLRCEWQYSNLMYMLAGYLCEAITGQRWEDFVQERIFMPLGMMNSNFSARISQCSNDFALPYKEVNGEMQEGEFSQPGATAPAGNINSNVEEMSQWLLFQLNKGKHGELQLLSEAQMAQIHRPHMPLPDIIERINGLSFASYAFGWHIGCYKGHRVLQHAGGVEGFSALMTCLPDDSLGIVVLTNKDRSYAPVPITLTACDRLLGLKEEPWNERIKQGYEYVMKALMAQEQPSIERVPDTQPSHPLAAYTGDFVHPAYGIVSIQLEGERLTFSYNARTFFLAHYHFDTFQIEGVIDLELPITTYLSFGTNLEGEIESLATKLEPTVKEIVFTR